MSQSGEAELKTAEAALRDAERLVAQLSARKQVAEEQAAKALQTLQELGVSVEQVPEFLAAAEGAIAESEQRIETASQELATHLSRITL